MAITHGRVPRWFYSTFIIKHTILFRGNGLLLALLLIAGLHFSSIVLNDLEMAFKFKSDRYLHNTRSQEQLVLWILFNLYFLIAKCNWNVEEELLKYLDGNIFNSVRLNLKRYWTGHICYGIDNMDRHSECLVRASVMPPYWRESLCNLYLANDWGWYYLRAVLCVLIIFLHQGIRDR